MAKDPAFLFYPGDWLGGTMGMTFEEKGAYMELLILQFNRGHITKHMIGQTVGQLWVNLEDKFEVDKDGKYFNARLDEEKEKRKEFVKSRRNNVLGINQYTKNKEINSGHMTSHMENVNVNENINNKSLEKSEKPLIPEIEEFLEYGKELTGLAYLRLEPALRLKYESWKVNGWKTGGDKPRKIKNWKNTLANTIPHLKPTPEEKPKTINRQTEEVIKSNLTGWEVPKHMKL